jgi:hypothetical protein
MKTSSKSLEPLGAFTSFPIIPESKPSAAVRAVEISHNRQQCQVANHKPAGNLFSIKVLQGILGATSAN